MTIEKSKKDLGNSTDQRIKARITVLEGELGKSGNQLGLDAKLGNGTVDGWTDKQLDKSKPLVERFLNHHKINPEWWETGRGEVFLTSVPKPTGNKEKDVEEIYRNIVEGNTEYILIPRSVLQEKYRLVALEQFQKDKEQMDKDRSTIDRLLSMNENLIAEMTSLKPKLPVTKTAKQNA
jgi:hypothetical protein